MFFFSPFLSCTLARTHREVCTRVRKGMTDRWYDPAFSPGKAVGPAERGRACQSVAGGIGSRKHGG